ncbi:conjugal transfer protein TraF [Shewanella sp. D64]|uniref:conjugal transfer protein TraF n=1 Tax=unclassified Shewanella TaxID=196818 RepID=UPI0022BA6C9E|nr:MULTISPECIES: conjugal transfer protein TraF [unclassified Shewanella]MEC4726087.1 conjugal transfer protein TraF [Shewanella sp. D64]MEC4737997.1 conjugal transfer protein TraF [Shewanella sp. E94]WBJ96196.1 conjugal transfer protein TraF [Shewanella sp. MTB7]
MKLLKVALCCVVLLPSCVSAGQVYYEARSDAMGGAGVASSNREGAAFINPALLALHGPKFNDFALLLPVLGADGADKDQMVDKFDALEDSYDSLEAAINAVDVVAIDRFRLELINDLESLKGDTAYVSAGLGFSLVIPSKNMPMAIFYKSYIDAVGVTAIEQSDIDNLTVLDPNNPPEISDLDSQGAVVAGAVSDFGVAISFPLSIVNMPISVGVSPKFQRIDTYNYVVSANNFDSSDFNDAKYRNDETTFNLDIGVAMEPVEGLIVGFSGRNLISKDVETVEAQGRKFTYQVEPLFTAGVAYDWGSLTLTTDIDLNAHERFDDIEGTQYWRLGGEVRATQWLALRLGYRHDMKDNTSNIYSLGTGFAFGQAFYLDVTGMVGSDDAIGGVLQTSYHF